MWVKHNNGWVNSDHLRNIWARPMKLDPTKSIVRGTTSDSKKIKGGGIVKLFVGTAKECETFMETLVPQFGQEVRPVVTETPVK